MTRRFQQQRHSGGDSSDEESHDEVEYDQEEESEEAEEESEEDQEESDDGEDYGEYNEDEEEYEDGEEYEDYDDDNEDVYDEDTIFPIPKHTYVIDEVEEPNEKEGWEVHQNNKGVRPADFMLSNCHGRKKALFVGINYFGQESELNGCIQDVHNIKKFIKKRFGFKEKNCFVLTDDQEDSARQPTRANIIKAMKWLVRDAQPNDSGHGGQEEDEDEDEDDGHDENIVPVDADDAGIIDDDTMHYYLVKPLPAGCRLTVIFDCCHSGSGLDLPYVYSSTGRIKDTQQDLNSGLKRLNDAVNRGDHASMKRHLKELNNKMKKTKIVDKSLKASSADCIMFSGCTDSQTSEDSYIDGFGKTGAMTYSFIKSFEQHPHLSYLQLLNSIRDILQHDYEQKPQLSSSHPVDLHLAFTM
ncbi:Ca(2+)-dependent cysteine protease [Entomortierella beljakovae]|nr:Ca(2+)-dependent cysteine protease [Entomortierella beljakovae]